jgi:uncharacterized membrane protein YeaQ/YmgE (transglycosylase-associated protein family)
MELPSVAGKALRADDDNDDETRGILDGAAIGVNEPDREDQVGNSGPGATRRISMGFIAWIVVGLIAGWLAGKVMKGRGYGVLVDIILGILGSLVGGWVFGLLGIWPGGGLIGSIVVAFVGAVILIWIARLVKKA